MQLDLRDITFYVINNKHDYEKQAFQKNKLERLGLKYKIIPGIKCEPDWIGLSLSKLKVLDQASFELPFAIIYDDVCFNENLQYEYDLPPETDALYLGQSRSSINSLDDFEGRLEKNIHFEVYNEQYLRLLNNLGGHAVIYLSEQFRESAKIGILDALLNEDFAYNPEISFTLMQSSMLVLSPIANPCYRLAALGGDQEATQDALYTLAKTKDFTELIEPQTPNEFLLFDRGRRKFFLFFDIFVHWTQKKITAVAAYYGNDLDILEYQKNIWLKVDDYLIRGKFIGCELDSWEPSIIIDFERPELEVILAARKKVKIEIISDNRSKFYTLETHHPRYEHVMSLIIYKNMRFVNHYLHYYLNIMQLDHIYFYFSNLHPKQVEKLVELVKPYARRSKVTLISWPYRWRNHSDKKQISQPPQQTHTLNKYGHGKWVGLFDLDEFLKLPGQTIREFLAPYDPKEVGSVSFGLRWFFYKGVKNFSQIDNPILEYLNAKKDPLGRKRQKLFASPQLARYARFHWVAKELKEVKIDDEDIFFYHFYFHEDRFEKGKNESGDRILQMAHLYRNYGSKADLENYVDLSLIKAKNEDSRIQDSIWELKRRMGKRALHYLNNICFRRLERILYVGYYDEQLLFSILDKNFLIATFITAFPPAQEPKVIAQFRTYIRSSRVNILNQKWDEINYQQLHKYEYFIYNGPTDAESIALAFKNFAPVFSPQTIIIITNWNLASVQSATKEGLENMKGEIFFQREMNTENEGNPYWGNGVAIFGFDKVMAK